MKKVLVLLFCILFMALLLTHTQASILASREALLLWFSHVVPALFPFVVLTSFLANSGAIHEFAEVFSPLMKYIGLRGECGLAIVLGAISGYPVGAVIIGRLMQSGLTQSEAERSLAMCNLGGPMFILGTISTGMLRNPKLGIPMLISHYLGTLSFAILLFLTGRVGKSIRKDELKIEAPKSEHTIDSFLRALSDSMPAMLKVGGSMVFFSAIFAAAQDAGLTYFVLTPVEHLLQTLNLPSGIAHAMLFGLTEMTGGCEELSKISMSPALSSALCVFIISIGGASVWLQTLSFAPVRLARYLAYKTYVGLSSAVICYLWVVRMPIQAASIPAFPTEVIYWPTSIAICAFIIAIFFMFHLINAQFTKRKGH